MLKLYSEYTDCIERRKVVLIRFLNLQAPTFLLKFQCKLIAQSFVKWLFHRLFDKIYFTFFCRTNDLQKDVIDFVTFDNIITKKDVKDLN